jgi:bacteriocin-like protein
MREPDQLFELSEEELRQVSGGTTPDHKEFPKEPIEDSVLWSR